MPPIYLLDAFFDLNIKNDILKLSFGNFFIQIIMANNNGAKDKKRVGVFSFTCDEGCSIFLIEIFNKKLIQWMEKIKICHFLSIQGNNEIEKLDIALVEGAITTKKDEELIKKIRKNTKILILLGVCAISGGFSAQRNFFSDRQKEKIKDDLEKFDFLPKCLSVKDVVKTDDEVPGCPMDEEKFVSIFEKYL